MNKTKKILITFGITLCLVSIATAGLIGYFSLHSYELNNSGCLDFSTDGATYSPAEEVFISVTENSYSGSTYSNTFYLKTSSGNPNTIDVTFAISLQFDGSPIPNDNTEGVYVEITNTSGVTINSGETIQISSTPEQINYFIYIDDLCTAGLIEVTIDTVSI